VDVLAVRTYLKRRGLVIRLVLTSFFFLSFPAIASWNGKPVPDEDIPRELKKFIEPQTALISLDAVDLNGDRLSDYVLVLEKQKKRPQDDDIEEGQRPLLLVVRENDGSLKLAKRNDKIVFCSKCGGVFGDPFESIGVGPQTFSVNHYGGSAWRWSSSFKFNYSRRDKTWQLVKVEEVSFHATDPRNTMNKKIYTPPKHFGKIDIADFDPESFRRKGAK
jgi:hypothetical protein